MAAVFVDVRDGLGTFIEFEAVLRTADDEAASPPRLAQLTDVLGIRDEARVSQSYSDLLTPVLSPGTPGEG